MHTLEVPVNIKTIPNNEIKNGTIIFDDGDGNRVIRVIMKSTPDESTKKQ